eukprot:1271206-Pleurochrysis_carterae.AAC.2
MRVCKRGSDADSAAAPSLTGDQDALRRPPRHVTRALPRLEPDETARRLARRRRPHAHDRVLLAPRGLLRGGATRAHVRPRCMLKTERAPIWRRWRRWPGVS